MTRSVSRHGAPEITPPGSKYVVPAAFILAGPAMPSAWTLTRAPRKNCDSAHSLLERKTSAEAGALIRVGHVRASNTRVDTLKHRCPISRTPVEALAAVLAWAVGALACRVKKTRPKGLCNSDVARLTPIGAVAVSRASRGRELRERSLMRLCRLWGRGRRR
jgi:hypothetical protein